MSDESKDEGPALVVTVDYPGIDTQVQISDRIRSGEKLIDALTRLGIVKKADDPTRTLS